MTNNSELIEQADDFIANACEDRDDDARDMVAYSRARNAVIAAIQALQPAAPDEVRDMFERLKAWETQAFVSASGCAEISLNKVQDLHQMLLSQAAQIEGQGWSFDFEKAPKGEPLLGLREDGREDRQPAFVGEVFDERKNALIDCWSGRWVVCKAWKRLDLPTPPTEESSCG